MHKFCRSYYTPVNCYNFLPTVGYYTLSTIYSPLYGYFMEDLMVI
jgi:hypothetical protein